MVSELKDTLTVSPSTELPEQFNSIGDILKIIPSKYKGMVSIGLLALPKHKYPDLVADANNILTGIRSGNLESIYQLKEKYNLPDAIFNPLIETLNATINQT